MTEFSAHLAKLARVDTSEPACRAIYEAADAAFHRALGERDYPHLQPASSVANDDAVRGKSFGVIGDVTVDDAVTAAAALASHVMDYGGHAYMPIDVELSTVTHWQQQGPLSLVVDFQPLHGTMMCTWRVWVVS
jgi:hypothetical protein